jgi:hypothetical protein
VDDSPTLITPNIGVASGTSLTATGIVTGSQLTSTIATGTAPLVITSTTPVANLNIGGNAATATLASNVTTNANLTGMVTSVGNATTVVTNANLTGEVTSVGNATTVTNAAVIGKVLTGYISGAGTVAASDNILQAIQKLNGNDATNANLTGPITSVGNATSIASKTGIGTKFVVDDSPTLITPNIGAATGTSLTTTGNVSGNVLVSTVAIGTAPLTVTSTTPVANLSIGGNAATATTAGTVTTNANLTGPITSVGNATSIASKTGIGTKFVVDDSPTLITPNIGVASGTSLTTTGGLSGSQLTSTIATGTAPLIVTSTTPVANLNIGGNAATATLASNVTTNANLTGMVTSVGNSTTVVTNANLTGEVTSVGNATTVTNSAVISKLLTGYVSGAGTIVATDNILQAIQKLNGNDATNANLTGPITSVGNATSIASKTGIGTKFVVDDSPTLITPNIGAASGTSLTATGTVTGSQLTSTIATGTAPLVVTSTTPVANLNIGGNATSATNATNTGITEDVATASAVYPTWVTANTGNLPQKVSSTKLSFVPSTGILTATGFAGNLTGNVTGNASTATALLNPRTIYGNSFDGTANLTQVITSTYGGTGNGFTKFNGPAGAEKTFTLPDANATILTSNTAVTVGQGGTGLTAGISGGIPYYSSTSAMTSSALLTQYGLMIGGGAGAAPTTIAVGTNNTVLHGNTGGAPSFGQIATADISNNAVTYGKMQAVTANRLLGSGLAGTAVAEITLGSGLSFTGTTLNATNSFANPSASIGLAVVNGSATTAMRSDAAPALDVSITPTWTGAHIWSALGTFNLGLNASGASINLNASSNFTTNINTGTSTGAVNIASGATGGNVVTIGNLVSTTGILERVGTGNYNLNGVGASTYSIGSSTVGGTISIGGTAQTGAITLGSSSASQTLNLGTGTGISTVNIANGTAGNTVSIANGTNTVAQTINIGAGTNAANNTINIGSGTNTVGATAVNIGTNTNLANTTNIEGGNGATAITLTPQTTGSILIGAPAGTGSITVGSSTATQNVNIGTGTGTANVNIATGAATSNVTIGSGGNPITSIVYASVLTSAVAVPRGNTTQTYTVTGAKVGGSVIVNPSAPITTTGLFMNYARVSVAGTVEIGWNNVNNTSPNLTAGQTLNILVINH